MLDETNQRIVTAIRKKFLEAGFALGQRELAQVASAVEQKIEGENDQIFRPPLRDADHSEDGGQHASG